MNNAIKYDVVDVGLTSTRGIQLKLWCSSAAAPVTAVPPHVKAYSGPKPDHNQESIEYMRSNYSTYMDFPKSGTNFFDICAILQDPIAAQKLLDVFVSFVREHHGKVETSTTNKIDMVRVC